MAFELQDPTSAGPRVGVIPNPGMNSIKSKVNPVESITTAEQILNQESMASQKDIPELVGLIKDRFTRSHLNRYFDEQRWLAAYRAYRGLYGPDQVWRPSEKSKVFVKITKTKVQAAYGQLIEVLFAQGKFPIGVEPERLPEGLPEFAHHKVGGENTGDTDDTADTGDTSPYGFPGDGMELPMGATHDSLSAQTKSTNAVMANKYPGIEWEPGPALDKGTIQIEPAMYSAKKLEKTIMSQLDECEAEIALRHALFECVLLGSGIIKGPFNQTKTDHLWEPDEDSPGKLKYAPQTKTVPVIQASSIWNFYQDPDAISIDTSEWSIERHGLSRTQMRQLTSRPYFRKEAIQQCLDEGPNYIKQWFEDQINDSRNQPYQKERYEVLEYWGTMDKQTAMAAGLEVPSDILKEESDQVQINAWVCGQHLIRLAINPFLPAKIPYYVVPYEINPYQLFGVGIPENMSDCQQIMNGHARLAIDNLAIAGSVILEVDETSLVPGQDMTIHAGKIFRRQGGQPGTSINSIKIASTAQDNLAMFDKFRQLADEATGIPSYSHGATGVSSTTRTASGMSMLMGAAALNIKTVVKNVDDYLLQPLGEAMFNWNMQFNDDIEVHGNYEVVARGTTSLMMKEVRSQRLMMFMQTAANPMMAPFVKWPTILREIAYALDIDPDKVVNSQEDAALYAEMMGKANGNGQGVQSNNAGPGASGGQLGAGPTLPGMGSPQDTIGSGGGQIGTGTAPMPGETGFSANTGQS